MVQIKSLQTGIKFKDTPIGKIPVDWEVVSIKQSAKNEKGAIVDGPFGSNLKIVDYVDEGVPVLQGKNITSNRLKWFDIRYVSEKKANELSRSLIRVGDILITKIGTLGCAAIVNNLQGHKSALIPANLAKITPDPEIADTTFLYHSLLWDGSKRRLLDMASRTAQPALSLKTIKSFLISLPPLLEQKRIAEILTTVNGAIEETDTIIEKTKELKKGLLLKLLIHGIGHKRFKKTEIGEIPEGWNVYTVEDIAAIEKNAIKSGPFGSELKKSIFVKSGYKVYGQEQVIPDNFSVGNYYISEDTFNRLKDFEIRPGDILISLVGTFGKISVVPDNVEKGIINPRLIKITLDKGKAFPLFIKFLLTSPQTQKQMLNYTHGLTMGILNTKTVKSLVFPIPPLDEQSKITNVLLGIDAEMMIELDHRNRLQTLKNSLMQVLLTGRIRVKLH